MMLSLGSLGTWFGSGIEWVNSLGWGAWPFVGVLFAIGVALAFLMVSRVRLIWFGENLIKANENSQIESELLSKERGAVDKFRLEYHPSFNHRRASEDGKQWITIRLKFIARSIVKDASPYLFCARRYENGEWSEDILKGMSIPLSWPGSGNRFMPRAIHKEGPVLLLDYDVEQRILSFVSDKKHMPYTLKGVVEDIKPGKYLLQIGVVGDGMETLENSFVLDWFGDFESLSLQRAPIETA